MPKNDLDLLEALAALGIAVTTHEHAPVFTVAESQALRDSIPGGHTKNLFVKDKKGRHFLLTVEENAEVDLKTVHQVIGGQGRVSFGKPEDMMRLMGVVPGAVTAFGVFNDTGHELTLVFDEALLRHDVINAHPLRNDRTTSIARDDLLTFVRSTGHEPLVLKLSGNGAT